MNMRARPSPRSAPSARGDRRTARSARAPARPRRGDQRLRSVRDPGARGFRRRLDARRGARAARHRSDLGEAEDRHHPQQFARHLRSTARSTPIAAASTAASIASPGRPTPIWACRRGSTSRASCSPSRASRRCSSANSRRRNTRPRRSRSGPTPTPISRSSGSTASPARCWRRCAAPAIRSSIVTKSNLVLRDLDISATWRATAWSRSSCR